MNKKRILIAMSRWTAARPILESLGQKGHEIYLVDRDSHCALFLSKYCTKRFIFQHEDNESLYAEFILEILEKNKIDLFIPISDLDTETFSKIRLKINKFTRMLLPSEELINLALDKHETYRYCLREGIPIPKTYFPRNIDDVRDHIKEISSPCMTKFRKGFNNSANRYFEKKEWLEYFYRELKDVSGWPVIQEYIPGDMGGFFGVCSEGKVLSYFMHRVEYKYSVGSPALAYSSHNPQLLELSVNLIKKLNWTGAINLDWINSEKDGYKLMEINPRFGGSTCLAYRIGVDLPYAYFCLAFGLQNPPQFNYKEGVLLRNLFPREILYCLKERSHIFHSLKLFFKRDVVIDLNWNDPKLVFAMFVDTLRQLARAIREKFQSIWG